MKKKTPETNTAPSDPPVAEPALKRRGRRCPSLFIAYNRDGVPTYCSSKGTYSKRSARSLWKEWPIEEKQIELGQFTGAEDEQNEHACLTVASGISLDIFHRFVESDS